MAKSGVYFQQQSRISNTCGINALNNLLGKKTFTRDDIDRFCEQLPTNRSQYRSFFGGDFDVSPLILALQSQKMMVKWLKKSENIAEVAENKNFLGFLINTKLTNWISRVLCRILFQSGRHWTCIKKYKQNYYYFDSLYPNQNQQFATAQNLKSFVLRIVSMGGTVLVVNNQQPMSTV